MDRDKTLAEARAFSIHYMRVMVTEARRRRGQPVMRAMLMQWARNEKARMIARETSGRTQGDLFA